MIRIRSKQDGFRRCGMPHPTEPVEYPDDKFSKEELEILKAEPMLVVEEVKAPKKEKVEAKAEEKKARQTDGGQAGKADKKATGKK